MPNYDLRCANCLHEFAARASISDRTEKHIHCPECGSSELEAVFKAMNFHVSRNNQAACPNSHICGAGCQHAHP